jgi:hypothetical protein
MQGLDPQEFYPGKVVDYTLAQRIKIPMAMWRRGSEATR